MALLPAAGLFGAAVWLRRSLYAKGVLPVASAKVPVAVVGNLTVGGGGKTPLVIALVSELQQRGVRVGVASRGFGGRAAGVLTVRSDTDWRECGDEPLLIARRTGAPVCVARNRVLAARALADEGCELVICDDGLQHYGLHRDMEICAVSSGFGFGNGWLLPAGPLREGRGRLDACDWIVETGGESGSVDSQANPDMSGAGETSNSPSRTQARQNPAGGSSRLRTSLADNKGVLPSRLQTAITELDGFFALADGTHKSASDFAGRRVVALAGVASPERFFATVRAAGVVPEREHALPDHGRMTDSQLAALPADIVLMTEKDAVKYAPDARLHVARIRTVPPPELVDALCDLAQTRR